MKDEISVVKGDIIRLVENNPDNMCKVNYFADVIVQSRESFNLYLQIMKKNGEEGKIPKYCLYKYFEGERSNYTDIYLPFPSHTLIIAAYADHTKENEEQLTIKKGDFVGRVKDNSDTWIVSCI